MAFSLLNNPFAVLGLTAAASPRAVHETAIRLDSAEARAAERLLIASRSRLETEIRFLPGASPEDSSEVLDALRDGRVPRLRALSLPARANVLAHIAAAGEADPTILRELADIQGRQTKQIALELISKDRIDAGMPTPNERLLGETFEAWTEDHAAALVAGARSLGEQAGASLLVELIKATRSDQLHRESLLRCATEDWERKTAARTTRLDEEAKRAEESLATKPTTEAANDLACAIHAWAKLTEPQRAVDAVANLSHAASVEAAGRWRNLAIDLANKHDAVQEALSVITALASEFGSLPTLGGRIRDDLKTCDGLVAAARARDAPEVKALEAAIAQADKAHGTLRRALKGGAPSQSSPPAVMQLIAAFHKAANAAAGERPWHLMRAFALALHNKDELIGPALSLTLMILSAARVPSGREKVGNELLHQLETDATVLRREYLSQKLRSAIDKNRFGEALSLIDRLLPSMDDAAKRQSLNSARKNIVQKLWVRRIKVGLALAFVAFIVWAAAQNNNQDTGSAASTEQTATASEGGAAAPAAPPAQSTFISPSRPAPGNALLTRAEILWCLEDGQILDAARSTLNSLKTSSQYTPHKISTAVERFNNDIADFNSVCVHREYYESDEQAILPELNASAADLRGQGREWIMEVVRR